MGGESQLNKSKVSSNYYKSKQFLHLVSIKAKLYTKASNNLIAAPSSLAQLYLSDVHESFGE